MKPGDTERIRVYEIPDRQESPEVEAAAQVCLLTLAADEIEVGLEVVAMVARDLRDVVGHQGIAGVHVERIVQAVRQRRLRHGADDVVAGDLLRLRPAPVPEAVTGAPEVSAYEQNQERREDARGDPPIQ